MSNYQTSNDSSLDDFVDFFFKDRYAKPTDYRLISSSNTTLAQLPAKEFIVYDYNKGIIPGFGDSTVKVMRILAIDSNNSNGYSIKYWAEPGLFNKYLPTAQKMINTFRTTSGEQLDLDPFSWQKSPKPSPMTLTPCNKSKV